LTRTPVIRFPRVLQSWLSSAPLKREKPDALGARLSTRLNGG
jgi:hypothetical protein